MITTIGGPDKILGLFQSESKLCKWNLGVSIHSAFSRLTFPKLFHYRGIICNQLIAETPIMQ